MAPGGWSKTGQAGAGSRQACSIRHRRASGESRDLDHRLTGLPHRRFHPTVTLGGGPVAGAATETVGTLEVALEHAARLLLVDAAAAEAQAREILKVAHDHPQALRLLGAALRRQGETEAAEAAYLRSVKGSVGDPDLIKAATALVENRLAVAEQTLRAILMARPTDVAAIRMLAETGMRLGRYDDAENLLARCVELAPGFTAARHNYATVLYRQNKSQAAIAETDRLLADDPGNPGYRNLKAAALARIGEYDQAIALYALVLTDQPRQPKVWMSYGHALKTVGRQAECIDAYRRCVALAPQFGEAWWSLANLKTVTFGEADVAAMAGQLARADLSDEDRFHLEFALGKAREDAGQFEASFGHYERGNVLRRQGLDYDADETTDQVRRAEALFTPAFLQARAGQGASASDPIFIVGLPRSGSTLVEQILASHSQVEGTQELPDIIALARRLGGKAKRASESVYPEALAELDPGDLTALGEQYMAGAQVHRKLGRPFFIDKMPNNWAHLGLIHLALPNAKIIDARRHPLGCGFSGFKQHFARGQGFTYDLTDIGRYYADYVALMAHFDAVLPGRVHRVIYEQMVADPEAETRSLLAHCGLPFEGACLRFYENDRAVRTASSEQVRRPIFTDAADHWRNYDPWLGPLKASLGPVLAAYPRAPGN
ncbi:MAG: sulfotransferase [Alphaproteobacteria bacterium]|nr:sulfotransferase [Alphaproteobacteria bacterium]MBU1514435.1 sulfotransferase [Alphaproteobacteria bacterium]MBU2097084.1 sulfotransferase [Alphaproteobacteria bacterium]MBU2153563.1 sulfotransferase [Alphaproteobacteria bacterium]MBU2308634.1 sulfotransferase [Alphaproteobacteria bacterium]